MDSSPEEEHPQLRIPMNHYAVCSNTKNAIIYIGTKEACLAYIRERELENCDIWHMHDAAVYMNKRTFIYEQE